MNDVLKKEDKKGERPYPTWLLQGFLDVLDECKLYDMELIGYLYTWKRGHRTNSWIEVKVDRALVTQSFTDLLTNVKLLNLEISTSDHSPVLLEPIRINQTAGVKAFRFENAWLPEPCVNK